MLPEDAQSPHSDRIDRAEKEYSSLMWYMLTSCSTRGSTSAYRGLQMLGAVLEYEEALVIPYPDRSLREGAIDPWTMSRYEGKRRARSRGVCEEEQDLNLDDIRKLARVFERLVDAGHTLLIVEHNVDVIKLADWVIDLGPEAGDAGGELVAMGRPEEVAAVAASHTGRWLRPQQHMDAPADVGAARVLPAARLAAESLAEPASLDRAARTG